MGEEAHTLIFCKSDCIFSFNFHREEIVIIYEFQHKLSLQPDLAHTLIFCKSDCIFSFNFHREEIMIIYEFQHKLSLQPDFFNMDHTQ